MKKIFVTVVFEVEDDDYAEEFQADVENRNLEVFEQLLSDLYIEAAEDDEVLEVTAVSAV